MAKAKEVYLVATGQLAHGSVNEDGENVVTVWDRGEEFGPDSIDEDHFEQFKADGTILLAEEFGAAGLDAEPERRAAPGGQASGYLTPPHQTTKGGAAVAEAPSEPLNDGQEGPGGPDVDAPEDVTPPHETDPE